MLKASGIEALGRIGEKAGNSIYHLWCAFLRDIHLLNWASLIYGAIYK